MATLAIHTDGGVVPGACYYTPHPQVYQGKVREIPLHLIVISESVGFTNSKLLSVLVDCLNQ